jgi:alpha-tubulin suppressor-like RCC1 family protein
MAACGENHTVFLMGNNSVQTCGSNEFGQLGLASDMPNTNLKDGFGGKLIADTPTQIEK